MTWSPEHSRALGRIVLAMFAGIVVSWLGLAALLALTIIFWPTNQVALVLLGVWLCASLLAWCGQVGGCGGRRVCPCRSCWRRWIHWPGLAAGSGQPWACNRAVNIGQLV
jgi:hypothetical protein